MEEIGKLMRPSPLEALLASESLPAERPGSTQAGAKVPVAQTLASMTRIDISSAGQLLGRLLLAAPSNGQPMLQTAQPLLSSAVGEQIKNTLQLAAALQDAIHFSGLFYESHLSDWVGNGRSKDSILQEPQARLATLTQIEDAPLAQLVQSQLDTLETRQLHWQGQAWPGAALTLSIEQKIEQKKKNATQNEHGKAPTDDASQWCSSVRFALPSLGAVRARLVLQEDCLQLMLHADNAISAALLRSHGGLLNTSLAACGTQLDAFSAHVDDNAGK